MHKFVACKPLYMYIKSCSGGCACCMYIDLGTYIYIAVRCPEAGPRPPIALEPQIYTTPQGGNVTGEQRPFQQTRDTIEAK